MHHELVSGACAKALYNSPSGCSGVVSTMLRGGGCVIDLLPLRTTGVDGLLVFWSLLLVGVCCLSVLWSAVTCSAVDVGVREENGAFRRTSRPG
jgi:hypothetical protein